MKDDDALADELYKAVESSSLAVKADVLAMLAQVIPVVGPTAKAVRDGEKQVNTLFQVELAGRKNIVDTLWAERKNIESALGRSGRGLARFIFFDFRKGTGSGAEDTSADPEGSGTPGGSGTPEPT